MGNRVTGRAMCSGVAGAGGGRGWRCGDRRACPQLNDPSQPNDEGITALHNAICGANYGIVDFLIASGANVNSPDSHGWCDGDRDPPTRGRGDRGPHSHGWVGQGQGTHRHGGEGTGDPTASAGGPGPHRRRGTGEPHSHSWWDRDGDPLTRGGGMGDPGHRWWDEGWGLGTPQTWRGGDTCDPQTPRTRGNGDRHPKDPHSYGEQGWAPR